MREGKHDTAIRALVAPGRSQKQIALMLGISQATVSYAIRGRAWSQKSSKALAKQAGDRKKPQLGTHHAHGVDEFTYTWRATRERLMAGR